MLNKKIVHMGQNPQDENFGQNLTIIFLLNFDDFPFFWDGMGRKSLIVSLLRTPLCSANKCGIV